MKDMILSLSGGLDSGSLLYEYKDRIAMTVSFNYGSNHASNELKCAEDLSRRLGIPHKVIDLREAFNGFKSALLEGADAIPDDSYVPETVKAITVPFRNGIFLSILAGLADSIGVKYVALASHGGDHELYKDCSPEFSDAMNNAITLGTQNGIEFFRPYIDCTKRELSIRGIKAGLNPDWTWSCYKGQGTPCGKCPTCVERDEALKGLDWSMNK